MWPPKKNVESNGAKNKTAANLKTKERKRIYTRLGWLITVKERLEEFYSAKMTVFIDMTGIGGDTSNCIGMVNTIPCKCTGAMSLSWRVGRCMATLFSIYIYI